MISQSGNFLVDFTKSSDEKRCKLNTSETSLDRVISTSQGTWWLRQARAMMLIEIRFCWCSVDLRHHVNDGKTNSYDRWFLFDSFAISVTNSLRCETQIHRNRGGYKYMARQLCKFIAINLPKSIWQNITNHLCKITKPNENLGISTFLIIFIRFQL